MDSPFPSGTRSSSFTPAEIRGMWVRTLTLLLVVVFSIVIVQWMLSPSGKLLFVLVPLLLTSFLLYLGSMSRVVLRGTRVDALSDSVSVLAACLCVGLIVLGAPRSVDLQIGSLAAPVFLLGVAGGLGLLSRPASRRRWIVLRALAIVLIGLVEIAALSILMVNHSDVLLAFALGALLPGGLSLLGLLRDHSDERLRHLGRIMDRDRNAALVTALGMLLLAYIYVIRPTLTVDLPDQIPLVDWAIMAVAFSLLLLLVHGMMRSMNRARRAGSWVGDLGSALRGEGDMEVAKRAIDGFVVNGRKEELLVLLTSTMLANGVPERSAAGVLKNLLDYREEEVGLAYRWTYGDIMEARRRDRRELVDGLVQKMSDTVRGEEDEIKEIDEG
jgi:hypothetical protein